MAAWVKCQERGTQCCPLSRPPQEVTSPDVRVTLPGLGVRTHVFVNHCVAMGLDKVILYLLGQFFTWVSSSVRRGFCPHS